MRWLSLAAISNNNNFYRNLNCPQSSDRSFESPTVACISILECFMSYLVCLMSVPLTSINYLEQLFCKQPHELFSINQNWKLDTNLVSYQRARNAEIMPRFSLCLWWLWKRSTTHTFKPASIFRAWPVKFLFILPICVIDVGNTNNNNNTNYNRN